jgi:hypothetical protein
MKRGQQKRVPAAGQQRSHHLFGAYNWRTDEVIWSTAPRKNSESFITFVEHLLASQTTDRPLVIILDNAAYHRSAASQAA